VLALITDNYYESKYCLYELGAAWALCRKIIPILFPPAGLEDIRDIISSNIAVFANNWKNLNSLKDLLRREKGLKKRRNYTNTYEEFRTNFISTVDDLASELEVTEDSTLQDEDRELDDRGMKFCLNFKYKAIAFDFDGTILQGPNFEYSWKEIWSHLGEDDTKRIELWNKHRTAPSEYTYQDWCDECASIFKSNSFNKSQIKEILNDRNLKIVDGFGKTIRALKKQGFKIAIISGGIGSFFYKTLSLEIRKLFDEVYINEFIYDYDGFLKEIKAFQNTESDGFSKIRAFEEFCNNAGCSTKEGIFVGEGLNDREVARSAGKAIAFPAHSADKEIKTFPNAVSVQGENISAILSEVFIPVCDKYEEVII